MTSARGRFVVGLLAVTLLLRLQAFLWPLKPDESGFLLVSRDWHPQPESIYGFYFVDRPPTLIGLFRLADVIGGAYAPRVAAAALVLLLVYAAYRTGLVLGGERAARWTGVAAAAFSGQPDFEMWSAKSESLGVPFVVVSCWLSLEALSAASGRRRTTFALLAGVSGGLALGMKQNLIGGAVFGIVLLVAALLTRRTKPREAGASLAAAAVGFAIPIVAVVGWAAAAGVRLHVLWDTLVSFRGEAFSVIQNSSKAAPAERFRELLVLFAVSGLALALGWFLLRLRPALREVPEPTVAVLVMVLIDLAGLVLGGSYWSAYLSAIIPGAVLAVAVVASLSPTPGRGVRGVVVFAAVSSLVLTTGWSIGHLRGTTAPTANYVGSAIREVSEPSDTIVVLYGRPDVVLASGLRSPYEHLWSLPARTLDPQLDQLRAVLSGDDAPTWVVAWSYLNSWDIDHDGKLQALLDARYVDVGVRCERHILLRADLTRPALPEIDCNEPWL